MSEGPGLDARLEAGLCPGPAFVSAAGREAVLRSLRPSRSWRDQDRKMAEQLRCSLGLSYLGSLESIFKLIINYNVACCLPSRF